MGELLWIKWSEILRIEYDQFTIDSDYDDWRRMITKSDDKRWVIV
jgi:hypothetical protein